MKPSLLNVELTDKERDRLMSYIEAHSMYGAEDNKLFDSLPAHKSDDMFFDVLVALNDLYWGYLYRRCIKKNLVGGRASVHIDRKTNRIIMSLNKEYFEKTLYNNKSKVWAVATIKHELLHILFKHVFVTRNEDQELSFLQNIAMDMSINSILAKELHKSVIVPGVGAFFEFKPGLTHQQYYKDLYFKCEADHAFARFIQLFEPDHDFDGFDNMPPQEQEKIKKDLIDYIKNGGDVPPEFFLTNEELLTDNIIPKNFCVLVERLKKLGQKNQIKESSFMVPNRYLPGMPGTKRYYETLKIYVLVDTSESISNAQLSKFYNYISILNKFFVIVLVPFSSDVLFDYVITYNLNRFVSTKRIAKGTTNFKRPMNFVNSVIHNNDVVIMFTDLEDSGDQLDKEDMPRNFNFVCEVGHYRKCPKQHYKDKCFILEGDAQQ